MDLLAEAGQRKVCCTDGCRDLAIKKGLCQKCYSRQYYLQSKHKNPERKKEYDKQYREKNRLIIREKKLQRKYGIGLKEYNDLLKKQGFMCGICGKSYKEEVLCVDHNHVTGKVRGLLCGFCNRAIGFLQDNPEVIMKAHDYLIIHGSEN